MWRFILFFSIGLPLNSRDGLRQLVDTTTRMILPIWTRLLRWINMGAETLLSGERL